MILQNIPRDVLSYLSPMHAVRRHPPPWNPSALVVNLYMTGPAIFLYLGEGIILIKGIQGINLNILVRMVLRYFSLCFIVEISFLTF
jgi:hypothetical protein